MYKIRLRRDFVFLNLQQMAKDVPVNIKFRPQGVVSPCPAVLNHEKMCIRTEVEEILFNLATNDHSDEAFLLTKKFWP